MTDCQHMDNDGKTWGCAGPQEEPDERGWDADVLAPPAPPADPATIERVAAAVLVAMRDLSRDTRWWAAMRTVEIPDNEQAAKFISEAAVRALQGEA